MTLLIMQTNNSVKLKHNEDVISAHPCVSSRNGFTMKLMKLKLQDPSMGQEYCIQHVV
jgi:hypothetical protein